MKTRSRFWIALLALLGACLIPERGLRAQTSQTELFARGDRLAEEGRYPEALDAWRRSYLSRLIDLRGREFLHPVEASILSREELRKFLVEMLEKELTPEDVRATELSLHALGFAGPELELQKLYTDLYTEQIAGFYNPETKRLYLIAEPAPEKPKKRSIWNLFSGSGTTFDAEEQKSVLSHEMSHALADQHFDLYSMQRSIEDDDDLSIAFSALVEGEAMLVMMLDQVVAADERDPDALRQLSRSLSSPLIRGLQSAALSLASSGALASAPRIVRESLIFPYEAGMSFCAELAGSGSWARIDAAFRAPPLSTEQILHPEKYAVDLPMEIDLVGDGPLPATRWRRVESNCVGEFGVRVLFRDALGASRAEEAAAGWDGDRYVVFDTVGQPEGDGARREARVASCVVWVTTWDEESDADEFALALAQSRGVLAKTAELPEGSTHEFERDGGLRMGIWRSGRDVVLVDHAPPDALAALLSWGRSAEKSVKEIRWRRFESEVQFGPRRRRI